MGGEFEQQPAVHGSEGQLTTLGTRTRARQPVEQPGELGRREIRIEQQPAARRDLRLVAGCAQRLADIGGSPVLPDDGGRHGHPGCAIPQHRGFALVADAHRRDIARREPRSAQRFDHGAALRIPDLERVVFNPPGLWKVLTEFALRLRDDLATRVEDQRARTGGALVEREMHFFEDLGAAPIRIQPARPRGRNPAAR